MSVAWYIERMERAMPDIVMVIAPETFRDEEYAVPKALLEGRGANVVTASAASGKCIGKLGMIAEAQMSVSDAAARSWDAVIFVGGAGAKVFFDDPAAHALAQNAYDSGEVVAAICIAPSILARAGLLGGVKATAFPSQKDDLIANGALWDDGPVVVDGRFVTGNGPESAEEFGNAVAALVGI